MLVLTRQEDESIVIGDDVSIVVLEVNGGRVRIGIDAPQDVAILRDELFEGDEAQPMQELSSNG